MKSVVAVLITISFLSLGFTSKNGIQDDAIKASFDEYIAKHFQTYGTDKREKLSKLGGGWARESFEPNGKFTVKAEKKNNYICEFELKKSRTEFHAEKTEAEKDNKIIKTDIVRHRHQYTFKQNMWSVKSRQHYNPWVQEWFDCNEKIEDGENKGATNLEGCWEK